MKVLQKRIGEPLKVVETAEKYFVDCARSFFEKGVYTERVYLQGSEFIMVVDEDGLPKQLPLNFFMPFKESPWPVQAIVGDVVFIRNKKVEVYTGELMDWEVTDITEQDIVFVKALLSPSMQSQLGNIFGRRF